MATGRIGTTPVLTTRWSKAPAAGTTSLSGLDDNSVSLVYSVGYEAVYQNGVLLSRGNDYTATNGTTITLTTATVAGDIIEVFANQLVPLTDTYSQTVANGKFINNTLTTTTGDIIYASAANTPARLAIGSTDQVLKVSGGIPAWGAAPAAALTGCSIYNSSGSITISNNTETTITFDAENWDSDAYHSTSTNTSRITIPSGKGGKYLVNAHICFGDNATGQRRVTLYKNGAWAGAIDWTPYSTSARYWYVTFCKTIDLAVGDYIEIKVTQTSGGNLVVYGGTTDNQFAAHYLGA